MRFPLLNLLNSSVTPLWILVILIGGMSTLTSCSATRSSSDPSMAESTEITVARIGDTVITLSEVNEQYERTAAMEASSPGDTQAAYEDFLERYVDFKLKVLHAREAGYADLPDLNAEIMGYRNQLARPYLLKEEVTEPLIRELHERRNTMVEASHILIGIGPTGTPADTLAAYNRMKALVDSVHSGVDFGDLAARYSEDPSAKAEPGNPGARGYLGFFGGGRMVYEFEDAAYSTPPGMLSPIVRTQFGYHLLFVHDRQPLPGDIRMAHIMIQPGGPSAPDSATAQARIREVEQKLAAGEDYAALALEYSDDRGSSASGGELRRMAYDAGLPESMRNAAYSLEPGHTSGIVETPFGYHIVKVLERYDSETYEEAYDRLISQISEMPRAKRAEEAFARSIRIERGGHVDSSFVRSLIASHPDSTLTWFRKGDFNPEDVSRPVAFINDSTFFLPQLSEYFNTQLFTGYSPNGEHIWTGLERFLNERAMDFEIAALEESNPAFGKTMQEFRDGLMLFRLMEDSVWTAASADSTALEAYYSTRADGYRFPDRTRVISFSSPSDSLLGSLGDRIRGGESLTYVLSTVQADTLNTVRVDTTYIQDSTNSVFDAILSMSKGQLSGPVPYEGGSLLLYHDGIDPARIKTFDEARAQAVNDYQDVLEKNLLMRLRRKYSVETYPDRLAVLLDPASRNLPTDRQ